MWPRADSARAYRSAPPMMTSGSTPAFKAASKRARAGFFGLLPARFGYAFHNLSKSVDRPIVFVSSLFFERVLEELVILGSACAPACEGTVTVTLAFVT